MSMTPEQIAEAQAEAQIKPQPEKREWNCMVTGRA